VQRESPKTESQSTHAEPPEFVAIVGELEDFTGRRLRGNGRVRCLNAYLESAEGFARIALSAQRRARLNPFGLLITMVDDREHLLRGRARVDERRQLLDAGKTPPPAAVCLHCETGGGRHTVDCQEVDTA
jgi:hypothetical protein